QRTLEPETLKELVEGKFVDALRTVAAEMTMEEMHEKRGEYVKRVKSVVAGDLLQNGLELEAVSLTQFDQTSMEFFNPSNAFDAEGLTRLTDQIERRKKIRNDIEQDTMIQVRNKNLETERQALDIDRELEYARLAQERELEGQRAAPRSDAGRQRAGRGWRGGTGGRARADPRPRGGGSRPHRGRAGGRGRPHRPRARRAAARDRPAPGHRARRAAARDRGGRAGQGAVRGSGRGRSRPGQGGVGGREGVHGARDGDGGAAQAHRPDRRRAGGGA